MNEIVAPPCIPDIEKDVISVLSNRPDLFSTIEEIIYSECFYSDDYRYLFDVMFDIHMSGNKVTQSSILHTIIPSGRRDILATYQEVKKSFSHESSLWNNVELLAEYAKKRALLTNSYKVINTISQGGSIDEVESHVSEASDIVSFTNKKVEGILFKDSLDQLDKLIDTPENNGLSGVDTGITVLNNFTGGWGKSEIIVIAARPGMGKTACVVFHAYKAAKSGVPVAFVTMEVSKAKIAGRILSSITGFNHGTMTKGGLADNQKRIVREKMKEVEDLPIYYYDDSNSSDINDICRTMRSWKRKFNIGIVIIDYIQLLSDRSIRDQSDQTRKLNSVVSKLTQLRRTLQVPLIELSQLNRESEGKTDKRPNMANLKGSGKIEEDATMVILLYRQDYYDSEKFDEAAKASGGKNDFVPTNDIEYIFGKNREGEKGSLYLKANMATNRFWDPDEMPKSDVDIYRKNEALNGFKHAL